jgi:putative transport protein
MDWLNDLLWKETVAHTILIYSVVIALGVALGKIRLFGVSLGITFVLFAGIAIAHFGYTVNTEQLDFIKDFGLILFVFSIGLQVGPGFFSSFKKGGLSLNLMALSIVIFGGLTTLIIHYITGMSLATLVGVMSGAVTNTPGLGAAQQVLKQVSATYPDTNVPYIGLGYAVAYPFGVVGIILTMLLLRKAGSVNLQKELDQFNEYQHPVESLPEKISIKVGNPAVFNKTIQEICQMLHSPMVISRILHQGELYTPTSETIVYENDIILVVAQKGILDKIVKQLGNLSDMDLTAKTGKLISKHIIVTNKSVFGKKLGELKLRSKYNINITRVYRSGIEFVASPNLELQMGDRLTIVGDEVSIDKAADKLGNSMKRLNEPNIIPIFIGILLGVVLGSVPILIPGIPNPLKLGLAGGPLIIAILLSKYGYKFSMTSYTTPGANLMLREIGIVLFLASVGIKAGGNFIPTLLSGDGFIWMGYGAIITLIPILIVGFFSRYFLKRNYFEICGLLAGSMTDPPALAYANSIAQSEAPTIAYATVYPLVMFSRILVAQLLILLFM